MTETTETTERGTRRIEHLPLADLTPDPRNPKAHSVETIDASVGRFGYIEPIVRDGRTGFIVSGHGRTKALTIMQERGEAPPEGVLTDAATRAWLVPVVVGWSSRTDTEASAALIALNRTTEMGGWVDDALLDLLDDLVTVEDGLVGVGFTEADREALAHLTEHLGSRDLDSLYEEVGDPTEEDGLVRVVMRLVPDLARQVTALLGSEPANHDAVARRLLGNEGEVEPSGD